MEFQRNNDNDGGRRTDTERAPKKIDMNIVLPLFKTILVFKPADKLP